LPDPRVNTSHPADLVPGLLRHTLASLQFSRQFREGAAARLERAAAQFRAQRPGLFRRKTEISFVGVHVRRGDHLALQAESGLVELKPGYYLQAMDLYRAKLGPRTLFLLVTDDPSWVRARLLPPHRNTSDLILATAVEEEKDRLVAVGKGGDH